MGTRIRAYAVDIPKFDQFLDSSLAELLCRYQRDGNDTNQRLTYTLRDSDDTFVARSQGAISGAITDGRGRHHSVFNEQQLHTTPVLRRSAREHLSVESIYQSEWLLDAFSNCRGINFIKRMIHGHRRWWIGSVLQSAEELLSGKEYQRLLLLFRKILRGMDCGHPIPDGDVGVVEDGLPFTPENDPDLRFGRWRETDCDVAESLLRTIVLSGPTFTRPAGPIGIAPDESEWHDWVLDNITSLLQVPDLEYDTCNVLTFIG